MTKDLTRLSLIEARQGLLDKSFTSRELTSAYIEAMVKQRSSNAFIKETPELALVAADQADKNLQKGHGGLLEGLPIAVKDLFCTKDITTTAGSYILHNFVPTYESTVTSHLWRNGAICLGKTNLDEFGMGSANTHSHFGPVKNPWHRHDMPDKSLVPGGSSGGSAAAVAGYYAIAATGTDTGGSIRQPASFCGIVGLKPTYGRCSRWGIVAFASSLDQAGPMTRTVKDAALMLQSMAGYDKKDSTSINIAVPDYLALITGNIKGIKVGIPAEYHVENMPPEIESIWQQGVTWLRQAGAEIVEVNLPHTSYALPAYYIIAPAEASSNLARYDGIRYGLRVNSDTLDGMYEKTRGAGFGREVKRRILIGTYALSAGYYDAYYVKAQKVRALITQDFDQAFTKVDVLLTPTTPNEAFGLEDKIDDPVMMYLNDTFTVPASLAGLPAISIPGGLSSHGLPLGLQLIGRRFDEATILNAASVLEQAANFELDPYGDNSK